METTLKWEETPRSLNLQREVRNTDDNSEDDQPLAWKIGKIAARQQTTPLRDQARPQSTKSSSKILMKHALKEIQKKTTHRKNIKRKVIIENEVQLENVLDLEGDEGGKETDEEFTLHVKALKEKPKALLDEDVPKKSVDPSKSKPSFVTTSQTTEGPGMSTDTRSLIREERQVVLKLQKAALQQASATRIEEPGPLSTLRRDNEEFKAKVGDLTHKLLHGHKAANERMSLLLQKLSAIKAYYFYAVSGSAVVLQQRRHIVEEDSPLFSPFEEDIEGDVSPDTTEHPPASVSTDFAPASGCT
ncbi:hypothetical protein HAX54_020078 [Datura stramonium]|uniref:Uncharacterized protein n=1 Tax=Datura stramonium TaxID=4076 RepID=A0ABS8UT85_DATST|nr:hypothetical protein [Datura stramonium]